MKTFIQKFEEGDAETASPPATSVPAIGLSQIVRLMVGMLWLAWAQQWDSYSGQYPAAIFFPFCQVLAGSPFWFRPCW